MSSKSESKSTKDPIVKSTSKMKSNKSTTKIKKSKKNIHTTKDEALKELQDIKKLLILQLLKSGIHADSVIKLLDIDQGNFSRSFPIRELIK